MHYHNLTRIISLLANTNTRLNIVDRMSIISGVNEYCIATEHKINDLEKQLKKLNNEFVLFTKQYNERCNEKCNEKCSKYDK